MSRLILVPQYPTKLRYQEWWWDEFPKFLAPMFDSIYVLGNKAHFEYQIRQSYDVNFAPIQAAVTFECTQIAEFMSMPLYHDDILLLNDLSFPGFFAHVLFHKRPRKLFAICHATSLNRYDYFCKQIIQKYPIEVALSTLFDKVIVATQYHKRKLGWNNLEVFPLPNPPMRWVKVPVRIHAVVSASRRTKQKRNIETEEVIEKVLGLKIKTIKADSWEDYYSKLAEAKVLFISAREETYGYQVVDAMKTGCIPIAPNGMSYPELLPREYLYANVDEAIVKVHKALSKELPPLQKLKTTAQSERFYMNLAELLNS